MEFLSDGTGTLAIKNDAGEVSDEELHRAILVTQQMRFSRVMKTDDWIKELCSSQKMRSSQQGTTYAGSVAPGGQ